MRIWSLHPRYLDTKGLVALWRESLLAQYVLEGKTKGYTHHPQLHRFKKLSDPVGGINFYLSVVYEEALNRNYQFKKEKIDWNFKPVKIKVTSGQVNYERKHLLSKLKQRDIEKHKELRSEKNLLLHPLFKEVAGEIEDWEIV